MASSRQRQRELARAKWHRQQARRGRSRQRARWFEIAGGVVVAVVAAAALSWMGWHIVGAENAQHPAQIIPSEPIPSPKPVPNPGPTVEVYHPPAKSSANGGGTGGTGSAKSGSASGGSGQAAK